MPAPLTEPPVLLTKAQWEEILRYLSGAKLPHPSNIGDLLDGVRDVISGATVVVPAQDAAGEGRDAAIREYLALLLDNVIDEHEAESEGEGFIVAIHIPYGDVVRARAALAATQEETKP